MNRLCTALLLSCWISGCSLPLRQNVDPMRYMKSESLIKEGVIDLRMHDLVGAEAAFRTALELTPLAAAFDGLGCVAFAKKDLVTAKLLFTHAIEIDSRYSEARLNLAILLEREGDEYGANEMYQQALILDPASIRARVNYGALLIKTPATAAQGRFILRQAKALAQSSLGVVRLINPVRTVEHGKDKEKAGTKS